MSWPSPPEGLAVLNPQWVQAFRESIAVHREIEVLRGLLENVFDKYKERSDWAEEAKVIRDRLDALEKRSSQ